MLTLSQQSKIILNAMERPKTKEKSSSRTKDSENDKSKLHKLSLKGKLLSYFASVQFAK